MHRADAKKTFLTLLSLHKLPIPLELVSLLSVKMSLYEECMHNGYRYAFFNLPTHFASARFNCEQTKASASLARHLDENDYLNLQKCTVNDGEYWIGLFENNACISNAIGPYTWIGDADSMCTNASPLSVHRQDGNQAVSIVIDSNNLTSPPESHERNWSENYRYICQYPVISPTIQAPSAALNSIAAHTRSTAHFSFELTKLVHGQTNLSTTSSFAGSTSSASVAVTFNSSKLLTVLIISGIVFLLASVLLHFLIRKGCPKSSKRVNNHHEDNFTKGKDNLPYNRYCL